MLRRFVFFCSLVALLAALAVPSLAVTKVGKRYNFFEFGAAYTSPVGSYDHIGIIDFFDEQDILRSLDADQVFDPSFSLHVALGQLRDRVAASIGVVYTRVNQFGEFVVGNKLYYFGPQGAPVVPDFDQFDLRLNVNYDLLDLSTANFTPYVGLGAAVGMIAQSAEGYETEYEVNSLLSANFGAEFKLWSSPDKRKFLTLASVNSFDLLSSGYRPRNLNIGGAIKFYGRP